MATAAVKLSTSWNSMVIRMYLLVAAAIFDVLALAFEPFFMILVSCPE